MTDKSQNAYLLRNYGITLAERNEIMAWQGNKCACCGRPFDGQCRVEVDHEHFKVTALRLRKGGSTGIGRIHPVPPNGWIAIADLPFPSPCNWKWAKNKAEAVKLAKKDGMRHSVRGILCGGKFAGCNRKLGRIDKPDWLRAVLAYLKNPPARQYLTRRLI